MKRLTNRRPNPIAARIDPPVGRALPDGWDRSAAVGAGGTYDRRNWDEVFKAPQWSAKLSADNIGNVVRGARLSSTASGI